MTAEARRRIAPYELALDLVNARPRNASSFGDGPFDGPEDLSLFDRCITRGLPGSMLPFLHGNSYQIVQAPGLVAIRYEIMHEARVIPLDGRPHAGAGIRLDMGDPRGHWDGDSLVVETTNSTSAAPTETHTPPHCASSNASRGRPPTRSNGRSPSMTRHVDATMDLCDAVDDER